MAVVALLALTIAGGGFVSAQAADPTAPSLWVPCAPRTQPIENFATEVARKHVDPRIDDVTLASKALHANAHVDVMVPTGYDPTGRTHYPVLYLLHGSLADYTAYVTNGIEGTVGDLPVIVVMPDDSKNGSYSDWYGSEVIEVAPPPAWESFHTRELIEWVDNHYPTDPTPAGRFIAGISSGGAGAMKYTAANPGLFAAVGELSGAVNTNLPGYHETSFATWAISYLPGYGPPGHCTWGDPATQEVVWQDNDPTYLAENFAGMRVFMSCGDGRPGPYDSQPGANDVVEETVWKMNQALDAAFGTDGIAHTTEFYGPGTHSWPYWKRELRHFLDWLAPTFGQPLATPAGFAVRSARPRFTAWDWTFTPHRVAREFTYLSGVGTGGLTATGSGALDVVTAPTYAPGASYRVADGTSATMVAADGDGRLHLTLDLGTSHTAQQAAFGPDATAGWRTVSVTIDALQP